MTDRQIVSKMVTKAHTVEAILHTSATTRQISDTQNVGMRKSYSCINDAGSVCPDRIGDVLDGDSVEMFVLTGGLHKELLVQVVQVMLHKHVDVAHDLQHIHTLAKTSKCGYSWILLINTLSLFNNTAHKCSLSKAN